MRKYLLLTSALAVVAGATSAIAAQTSANFQTRINIQTACTVTATNVDFGNVGIINGTESASGTVAVNCSNGTPFTLSFNSSGPAALTYNSAMTNSTNGEDVAYSASLSGAGGTGPANFTILATLPTQVTPSPAQYTDNKVVYVNY